MLRSDRLVVLIAFVLGACEQRSDLGGQAQDRCLVACDPVDAGQVSRDAGIKRDGGIKRPASRIESAKPDEVDVFGLRLEGMWHGFSKVPPNGLIDNELDPPIVFEVLFTRTDIYSGTFQVSCVEERNCDPFGFGSATPDGGRFRIMNLYPDGRASGELVWSTSRSPGAILRAPFSNMKRDDAGGPALEFDVGSLGGSPVPVMFGVTLGYGPQPADDGSTPDTDAGPP